YVRIHRHPLPTPFPYTSLFRSCEEIASTPTVPEPRRDLHPHLGRGWAAGDTARDAPRHPPVPGVGVGPAHPRGRAAGAPREDGRSEEHTSELQSHLKLVCRLWL